VLDKLAALEARYEQLEEKFGDPAVLADGMLYQKVNREHKELEEVVIPFRVYKRVCEELDDWKSLLHAEDSREERVKIEAEMAALEQQKLELEEKLRFLILPKDPFDDKNIIMEIRAGTGGEEAGLFAGELFRMYSRYADGMKWKTEVMDSNATELGGFKEVVFSITGKGAYSKLKHESGVHRVQRVPATESGGRIHTSTVTVAVLPEAEDVNEVPIEEKDLRIDVFRASGAGGQHVNKTESAVRLTHIPTGIVVSCQDERSQIQNREKAMRVLRAKLLEMEKARRESEMASNRKSQVGTGERSEKIRTYNFPQSRITDHRIGLTTHNLSGALEGDIEDLIAALVENEQKERLAEVS
jgi:peptide chain release factor 1